MRFSLVFLSVISAISVATADATPWRDEPQIVTTLDMEAAFRQLPPTEVRDVSGKRSAPRWEGVLYMKLCARPAGERSTGTYRHEVEVSIEKKVSETEGCGYYRIDYRAQEGAYPQYHLILPRSDRRVPARRIYLLSDDFRWFLYLSGSSPGDVVEHHDAEVIRLELWDAGNAPLHVGFETKCRGHVADHESDCYDCHLWEMQGRSLEDLRSMYDGIFKCIREKLLDSGPRLVRWSRNNTQCFIDYSMCVE